MSIAFTLERLGVTLAGGAIALLAALAFWPVWERDRLPGILAAAFRATDAYVRMLSDRIAAGGSLDAPAIAAKRHAETATSAAFSSLQRMNGDPRNQREGLEHAAALVNGNQRIIRALAVLAVHVTPGPPSADPWLTRQTDLVHRSYEVLARTGEGFDVARGAIEALLADLGAAPPPGSGARAPWLDLQLTRIATELSAMLVAVQDAAPASAGEK